MAFLHKKFSVSRMQLRKTYQFQQFVVSIWQINEPQLTPDLINDVVES